MQNLNNYNLSFEELINNVASDDDLKNEMSRMAKYIHKNYNTAELDNLQNTIEAILEYCADVFNEKGVNVDEIVEKIKSLSQLNESANTRLYPEQLKLIVTILKSKKSV